MPRLAQFASLGGILPAYAIAENVFLAGDFIGKRGSLCYDLRIPAI
jgi:hypothetical protein